ncbi:MAG: PP2C family protein-serine/threonine phosphatase, partial [Bryobacteraceae bacterium]
MRARLRQSLSWFGWIGIAFLVLLIGAIAIGEIAPRTSARIAIDFAAVVAGIWLAVRLLRRATMKAIWGLRNRLLVTYVFISVVPTLLILALAANGGELLMRQVAVFLVTSELDRRVDQLQTAVDSIVRTPAADRPMLIQGMMSLFYQERYPGIEVLLRDSGRTVKYPQNSSLPAPAAGWPQTRGVLLRDGHFYLWCYQPLSTGDITITAPLTREFLNALVPNLGIVDFGEDPSNPKRLTASGAFGRMPPAYNRFDIEFLWWAIEPTAQWDRPGVNPLPGFLIVRSRVSATLGAVFNRKSDLAQGILVLIMLIGIGVFLVVEIISVVIGITMTRTITGAVHRLYQGTRKVIEGDFSHRIEVKGKDQLADLSLSFNQMTANTERLLVVAKEKERLQSEIEIAQEVQSQLYPRKEPRMRTLRLAAVCQPARMVSGDYYDYETLRGSQIALAIGDVAGKG